jgi:cell division protein FtsL
MRHWSWILTAVAIVALVVLVIPLVYTQKKISLVQHELGSANEQILRGRAASAELEKVITNLKTELDAAGKLRSHLQTEVVDTNFEDGAIAEGI